MIKSLNVKTLKSLNLFMATVDALGHVAILDVSLPVDNMSLKREPLTLATDLTVTLGLIGKARSLGLVLAMRGDKAEQVPAFELGIVLAPSIARIGHYLAQHEAPVPQALGRNVYQRDQLAAFAPIG
jgi:hypothetical protein